MIKGCSSNRHKLALLLALFFKGSFSCLPILPPSPRAGSTTLIAPRYAITTGPTIEASPQSLGSPPCADARAASVSQLQLGKRLPQRVHLVGLCSEPIGSTLRTFRIARIDQVPTEFFFPSCPEIRGLPRPDGRHLQDRAMCFHLATRRRSSSGRSCFELPPCAFALPGAGAVQALDQDHLTSGVQPCLLQSDTPSREFSMFR